MLNPLRIVINLVLAAALAVGGTVLLMAERWTPIIEGEELAFSGPSLHLLTAAAFLGALLSAAVARAWLLGTVAMPPGHDPEPHPGYQGHLLVRYWYLSFPALGCAAGAIWLASLA